MSQYFKTLLQVNGFYVVQCEGRTWEANRQGSGCGLLEGRSPNRKFSRKNATKANIRNAKNLLSIPHEESWSTKAFDSKSLYALRCCPSHSGHHFIPTAQQNTLWHFNIPAPSKRRAPFIQQTERHILEDLNPQQHRCDFVQLYAVWILAVPIKAIRVFRLLSVQLAVQKLDTDCHYTSCLSVYFTL